jgi:hypothetical protein
MNQPRFSKAVLLDGIDDRISALVLRWGFDSTTGHAQISRVARAVMTRPEFESTSPDDIEFQATIAYGEFDALTRLADEIDAGEIRR